MLGKLSQYGSANFDMGTFIDVVPTGLKRFSEWHEEMGVSRSMAYQLLKLLEIEPEMRRVPGSKKPASFLTLDQQQELLETVQLLNQGYSIPMLQDMYEGGKTPANTDPDTVPEQSGGLVKAQSTELAAEQSGDAAEDDSADGPELDPDADLNRLKAIINGDWYTREELAIKIARSATTIHNWKDNYEVRPEIFSRRRTVNQVPYFKIVSETVRPKQTLSAEPSVVPVPEPQRRTAGFDVTAAIYDVAAVDCTGSDLFHNNRIVG